MRKLRPFLLRAKARSESISHFFHTQSPSKDIYYDVSRISEVDSLIEEISVNQETLQVLKSIDPDLRLAIRKKLMYEWTYNSNAIEGSTLSLGDTIFYIENGITVAGKPLKDFLDASNHVEAIDFTYDVVRKNLPFSAHLIKRVNALLLHGQNEIPAITPLGERTMRNIQPGDYKKLANHVLQLDGTIHRYVEPLQVASEIDHMVDWVNSNIDNLNPVIVSAIAHYNMVRIHPFEDGNGRGARLLMNLILLREDYQPAVVKQEDRQEYLSALKEADEGNLSPFIRFIAQSALQTQNVIISVMEDQGYRNDLSSKIE